MGGFTVGFFGAFIAKEKAFTSNCKEVQPWVLVSIERCVYSVTKNMITKQFRLKRGVKSVQSGDEDNDGGLGCLSKLCELKILPKQAQS